MTPWPSLAPYGKFLSAKDGELFYYDSINDASLNANTAKPALVLIHGLGDEADTWRHVFPQLAKAAPAGYRVLAPDLPGFGRSAWKGNISVEGHRDAVLRLMAETGAASASNPAVLVGSSLGAGIAELAAFSRPELVKSLVLIDGCFPVSGSLEKGFFLLSLPFIGKRWYRGFRKNHEAAWKSLFPYYGDLDAMDTADREFLRERVIARVESPNQERGYLSTVKSMNHFTVSAEKKLSQKLSKYPGKITLLWGDKDAVFPQEKASLFRSLRPDAELIVIPGGHLPHQEKPEECAAEIIRTLA